MMHAAVVHAPIKSGIVLNPGQSYTATIAATKPTEIGWQATQAEPCTTNCIEATDITNPRGTGFATSLGGAKVYIPAAGKVSVEYKNISNQPVTINVYRVNRTCDAEACKYFPSDAKGRSLTYKIGAFKSITTSKDGSYSVIAGATTAGKPFIVHAIWWTDDPHALHLSCSTWIKRYIDNHTPPEKYSPYILSGLAYGEGNSTALKQIDDCVPNAPHYGVAEDHVYK